MLADLDTWSASFPDELVQVGHHLADTLRAKYADVADSLAGRMLLTVYRIAVAAAAQEDRADPASPAWQFLALIATTALDLTDIERITAPLTEGTNQ